MHSGEDHEMNGESKTDDYNSANEGTRDQMAKFWIYIIMLGNMAPAAILKFYNMQVEFTCSVSLNRHQWCSAVHFHQIIG